MVVLNLIITGIPSILGIGIGAIIHKINVLNLIITGIPSIRVYNGGTMENCFSFKPYYNWNTFNTNSYLFFRDEGAVLNLIITGIPSIRRRIL